MDPTFFSSFHTSGKLIFLVLILLISLSVNCLYFITYLKHRHKKEKYNGKPGTHPAHANFKEISYVTWLLKHLPLKLQPKHVKNHPHKPYPIKDSFLVLMFHPHFGTVRKVFILWMVFIITLSSSGIYALIKTPDAQAATGFNIKTGYYMGNGTGLSVTGVGFQPQLIIIKSDTAAGSMVWKSSAMATSVTTYLGVATADNTETEITLDADGFTVSAALEVNTAITRYTYTAFYDSNNCLLVGTMCVGSYTGTGTSTKDVSTGFQPDLVWVKRSTAVAGNFRTSAMPTPNSANFFAATTNDATANYFTTLNATSFTVGVTNNANAGLYYFAAFKNVANTVYVGSFLGNATDDRNITDPNFEPDFVLVKQASANAAVFNNTETWGDYSSLATLTADTVNNIQDLTSTGFQVGTTNNVNANAVTSYYFAFGGAPDPSSAGSFTMQSGNYTGNGVAGQVISLSFKPDLVIIKANATQLGVWTTSLDTNLTHYMASATAGFANGITAMGSTSFTVGTDNTVNANLTVYQYTAFGNATSPLTGAGASDFVIGKYIGNAQGTGKVIDHLGIAPSMVVASRDTGAFAPVWRSSTMSDNNAAFFTATVNSSDGTVFKTLNSDGFTTGLSTSIDVAAVNTTFFAFKTGATTFKVGSYAGTGISQSITSMGFSPDYVWTKRDIATAVGGVHRSSDSNISGANAQYFLATANASNLITALGSDDFTVGTANDVNVAGGGTYYYAAWNSTTSASPPATPTNSAPASAATAQDLNTTLTASDYSDPESNAQTDSQWQVDDDSDFSSPVWTRTAGTSGVTTAITSGNGTFANELVGKTELDHNTTYYWRVRYSDGVYSSWSTATNFTSNVVTTPTNSSPADQATITTLTPTLTASAFLDEDGESGLSAEWQINTSNSFSSPLYDSGTIAYGNSYVVPTATLSNNTVYYWQVRYQDGDGSWSSYSTATRFLVQQSTSSSIAKLTPLFGSTVVDQGDSVKIDAQFLSSAGAPINDATTTINIYKPSGTLIVTSQAMSYIASSNGIYRYAYTIPSTNGSYLYDVTATSGSTTGYGSANFEVRTYGADITATRSTLNTVSSNVNTVSTNVDTINSNVTTVKTKTDTINWADVTSIKNATVSVTGSVSDTSPADSSFKTDVTSSKDDFYKNMVITFTSGDNSGQSRRISGYSGSDKKISVDPAYSYTPANGDTFLISIGSVRAEELAGSAKSTIESIQSKLNSLSGTLPSGYSGMYDQLKSVAASLSALGVIQGSGADSLYTISAESKDDVKYLKNKLLDLQAALEINKAMLLGGQQNSIFSSWYTFHSVVLNMLIANPTDRKAEIPFKAYLPKEVKPENIISTDGLKVEYDEGAQSYFVAGNFNLGGKESVAKKVEIKDIWQIDESELNSSKTQANDLYKEAQKTAYSAQALVLKNDAINRIDKILRKQKDNTASPTEHIQTFRENQDELTSVHENLKKLTDLVTSAGAGRGLLASVGGIQTISTWGIIVVLIAGLGILGAFSFSMWKHQMMVMTALSSGKFKKDDDNSTEESKSKAVAEEIDNPRYEPEKSDPSEASDEPIDPEIKLGSLGGNFSWTPIFSKLKVLILIAIFGIIIFAVFKGGKLAFNTISKGQAKSSPSPVPTLSPSPSPSPLEKKITITETGTGWLNVRADASTKADILRKVNVGESFVELDRKEVGESEEWIKIKLDDSTEGWIIGKYTEVSSADNKK